MKRWRRRKGNGKELNQKSSEEDGGGRRGIFGPSLLKCIAIQSSVLVYLHVIADCCELAATGRHEGKPKGKAAVAKRRLGELGAPEVITVAELNDPRQGSACDSFICSWILQRGSGRVTSLRAELQSRFAATERGAAKLDIKVRLVSEMLKLGNVET